MARLKEKVVLAYSGDLDTTAITPWLREHFNCEIICCCVDCGQDSELSDLKERVKPAGTFKFYLFDENDGFVDDYILPCLQAGLDTKQTVLLGNALSHPLIAQKLVELARKEHAIAICHGATGKGSDQVRFELSVKALTPKLKIIAPRRMTEPWPFHSRKGELAYCRQKGIDLPFDASHAYSHGGNPWHSSHEDLELEDPAQEPMFEKLLRLGVSSKRAPDTETLLRIDLREDVPVSLNGERMKFSDLLRKLNEIGGKNDIDISDIVEDHVVGMKAHDVYEIPSIAILLETKWSLETLVLDGGTLATRRLLGEEYASLLYAGRWFTPLREALQTFFAGTQSTVDGEVRLRLYKGNLIRADASSVFSLYAEDVASLTTGPLYRHRDVDGSIALFGLPLELRAEMLQRTGIAEEGSAFVELPVLPLPVKTTISRVRKTDEEQAVSKVVEKKGNDKKTPEKKEAVKKGTTKEATEKKTDAKKAAREVLKKTPEKR